MMIVYWLIFIQAVFCQFKKRLSKQDELKTLQQKSAYISLDSSNLRYFTDGADNNYSLIVHFKLKGYNVPSFFHRMNGYLEKIARSLVKKDNKHISNVFIAKIIDNDLTNSYCKKFNYNVMPIIVHFSPNGVLNRKDLYDVRWNDGSLESIRFWIRARTGYEINVVKEFSIFKFGAFVLISLTIGSILYLARNKLKVVNNYYTWSILSIGFVSIIQGGVMHSIISGSPFVGGSNKGNVEYISKGMRVQFGIESIIVGTLYCLITYSLINLNDFKFRKFSLKWKSVSFILLVGSIYILKRLVTIKAPWLNGD